MGFYQKLLNNKGVYLIAEAGVNHGGDIEIAKEMIKQAASAGADAIKFQTYKAGKLASKHSPAYWDQTKEKASSQYELFKKYDAFWEEDYQLLSEYCFEYNIDFLSTPFDLESVSFLYDMMPAFKIASADITNFPLLRKVASYHKPVILSTGASTLAEIDEAIQLIEAEGNSEIALLHCVLSYPTLNQDANLNMIRYLQNIYPQYIIGYSDHTIPDPSLVTLNTSVYLGARIIEKHFTLDKSLEGNDHYHAMETEDIVRFKDNMKIYLDILGESVKRPVESEAQAIKYARRSLVAKVDIPSGLIISEEMLTCKRPGIGISPKYLDLVVGRTAKMDIKEDTLLNWDMV